MVVSKEFPRQFTRRDAELLVRRGVIREDATTELLNGAIVAKNRAAVGEDDATVGFNHCQCVERLSCLRNSINSDHRHVESQQPLVCTETHVPEPDFMVLRGTIRDYSDLPAAADAFCVIEVADASYERDAGEKLAGYARAGITQYIIINLRNRTAEVYTTPDQTAGTYPLPTIIDAQGELPIRIGQDDYLTVPLVDILS